MKTLGIIPARLESTRLPGKALLDIGGKPMIQRVWEQAVKSGLDEVVIATDSEKIYNAALQFGAAAYMTSPHHVSGTGRLAELAEQIKADFYVNIQGDEPFISPEVINGLVEEWRRDSTRDVYTAANPNISQDDFLSPNVVKVVTNLSRDALYFSRSPIPHFREQNTGVQPYKHIGIYGFTAKGLELYKILPAGMLEKTESLEQLRFLENGEKIRVFLTGYESIGVDTEDDLLKVRNMLKERAL
ncbi:3-deoxy-manno-octulosonate cytidylyltransferase [Paenibacillus mucilaginosus]|nr:3-deoxy-manno-octulosonate cytidylyltransferase [Paenibacillus mucilaginosus]MCG7217128.1 3-deoxy-manno-octulosonate cytidylyltransferase [Paenibacillus mucilaginosus]WDM28239.1 3-deoxy-manno-octulosonate cytidylyltransferase [Paenibacillus mucilaginosus]